MTTTRRGTTPNRTTPSRLAALALGACLALGATGSAQATKKVEVQHIGFGYYVSVRCYDDNGKGVGKWRTNMSAHQKHTCRARGDRNVRYVRVNLKNLFFRNYGSTKRPHVDRQCENTEYACVTILGKHIQNAKVQERCGRC